MTRNKDRLYVALYARSGRAAMPGREDIYHWTLLVGPKREKPSDGRRDEDRYCHYHAKETMRVLGTPARLCSEWAYEESPGRRLPAAAMLLVRVAVAKVTDETALRTVLSRTPVRGGPDDDDWNCVVWVRDALDAAAQDPAALRAPPPSWSAIRDAVMDYVTKKREAHRFDGTAPLDVDKVPTWDMLTDTELIP